MFAALIPLILSAVAAAGGAAGGIASAVQKGKAAKLQQQRATDIASGIKNIQKDPLSPYMTDALKSAQDNAASGLPGKDTYSNQLDNATAEQLNTIKNASPSGSTAAAALARTIIGGQKSQQNLQIADAQTRLANQKNLQDVSLEAAKQDTANQAILTGKKTAAQGQVEALLNAAMANKQQSTNDAASSVTQSLGSLASNSIKAMNAGNDGSGGGSQTTVKSTTTPLVSPTGIGSTFNAVSEASIKNVMDQYGISRDEAIAILNATNK